MSELLSWYCRSSCICCAATSQKGSADTTKVAVLGIGLMGRWVLYAQGCSPLQTLSSCLAQNQLVLVHVLLGSTSYALRCHSAMSLPHTALRRTALFWLHAGNKVARRLSEEGCQVAAWNRDASKAEALSAAGISIHKSAQDAAQASDVLVLMLSDAEAIKDVLLSTDQPVNLQDKVVVQMGTIGQLPA